MKKLLLLIPLLVLAFPGQVAKAQTPQHRVIWKYAQETALNVNTNYVQVVRVDNAVITTATLKPTCVQAAADVECAIALGTLASGPHNVSVSATVGSVEANTTINNLNLGANAPKNPTDFRYQINITVNVP